MFRQSQFHSLWLRLMTLPAVVLATGLIVPAALGWFLLSNAAGREEHDRALSLLRTLDAARAHADEDIVRRADTKAPLAERTGAHAARQIMHLYETTPGAPSYRYRVAVLNPLNPEDRADEFEARMVASMAADPRLRLLEQDTVRSGRTFRVLASPIIPTSDACVSCHSGPRAASLSGGRFSGVAWRKDQVVGASMLYLPVDGIRAGYMGTFWAVGKLVVLVLIAACGIIAWRAWGLVVRPAEEMMAASQAIRKGEWGVRIRCQGSDELRRLAASFQDTTLWLRERVAAEEKLRALFQQFVPAAVAARALGKDADGVLIGTRHAVTVMVLNVRNFHLLQEHLPPDQTVATLNEVFSAVNRVIVAHRGIVSKYLGDTVLAFFGMPLGNDDHVLEAIRAALDMPRALQDLYLRLDEEHGWELGAGVGIATGEALVGHFGSTEHMEYTVLGDVVLEAHRLEDITRSVPEEDTICISEAAYREVMSDVHVYDLGERSGVDGKITHAYVVQGFRSEARTVVAA